MPPLDGTQPVKPVPFDSHEQKVRAPHTYSAEEGYQPAEASDEPAEYPKAVDHVKHPSGLGHEPVVVNDAKEEAAFNQAQGEAEDSEK